MPKLGSCQLQNLVLDVLRAAARPLTAREIVEGLASQGVQRRIAHVSHLVGRMADRGLLDRGHRDQAAVGQRARVATYTTAAPRPTGNAAFLEAIKRVSSERAEQLQRYPLEDDDKYAEGQLWYAAVTYIGWPELDVPSNPRWPLFGDDPWPWEPDELKPRCNLIAPEADDDIEGRLRDLSKGCALALAEMERLIRMRDAELGESR